MIPITNNNQYQCLEAATAVVKNMVDGQSPLLKPQK
jgi:hypothetical protein